MVQRPTEMRGQHCQLTSRKLRTTMKPKKTRKTLNEQIKAAPTHADKWQTAASGGPPLTPIQQLAFDAFPLQLPVGNGTDWKKHLTEQLKTRFADLFFPSLMDGKTQPFVELIEAMAESRKSGGSVSNFNRGITVNPGTPVAGKDAFQFTPRIPVNKDKGRKKEAGRRLRLALLSLDPEDRQSVKTILDALGRNHVEYSDESHVRRVMRELDVCLLNRF
jgi:hypothetical protein